MKHMSIITERHPQGCRGVLEDKNTVRVLSSGPLFSVEKTDETIPLDSIKRYLPPVDPPNIIALGLNYRAHAAEGWAEAPSAPILFIKTTNTVTAHREPIILPREAPDEVDYEVELAVIIGERAKHVSEEKALDHVFGYTIGQDISARDCQMRHDKQWARAKCFDTFCPLGPWIETALDPSNLMVRTKLNGKVMQEATTADMIFAVPFLVSYVSRMMTLLPGTVIMTGTPSGVGFPRKPPVFLRDGDTIITEIEGIGRMENPVVREV